MTPTITFTIPVKTVSEANKGGKLRDKIVRKKSQRYTAKMHACYAAGTKRVQTPCVVRLTRIGPKTLDSDNLGSALKACRDGIADWLEIDDGCELVAWTYGQEKGEYGVRVEVFEACALVTSILPVEPANDAKPILERVHPVDPMAHRPKPITTLDELRAMYPDKPKQRARKVR